MGLLSRTKKIMELKLLGSEYDNQNKLMVAMVNDSLPLKGILSSYLDTDGLMGFVFELLFLDPMM